MKHKQLLTLATTTGALLAALLSGCSADDSATTASAHEKSLVPSRSTTAAAMLPTPAKGRTLKYDRPGFLTFERDERLWVFANRSEGLEQFLATGEPAKCITWIGAGPNGMTLRSDDSRVLQAYTASKPGFRVIPADDRLWVFEASSAGLAEFLRTGEPAKSVTWVGAGPRGVTLRSDDADVLLAYLASKPGFATCLDEGRIWVFRTGSDGHQEFLQSGEPAKSVTWIGAGPRGASLRSDDADALLGYIASKPGFQVYVDDGRLWVFRDGSEALQQFLEVGEPAKSITLIGVGPRGASLRGAERGTLDAYLAAG